MPNLAGSPRQPRRNRAHRLTRRLARDWEAHKRPFVALLTVSRLLAKVAVGTARYRGSRTHPPPGTSHAPVIPLALPCACHCRMRRQHVAQVKREWVVVGIGVRRHHEPYAFTDRDIGFRDGFDQRGRQHDSIDGQRHVCRARPVADVVFGRVSADELHGITVPWHDYRDTQWFGIQ